MTFGSVCSGIEAASVAWHPLGWRAAWLAEIDPFPSAVLAHHYPETPNHGDFTRLLQERPADIDLLVGGTPCQSFSVAGLRGGLTDHRGNLALAFMALVDVLRPRWVVWENVPGVLSSNDGRDFGSILGALGKLGYGFAYRVLDAQYFGLAQRRKRVFVVGHLGDWRRAAAVLFEPEGVRWDSPPSRQAGTRVAGDVAARLGRCGADDNAAQAAHLQAVGLRASDGSTARSLNAHPTRMELDTETFVAFALRGRNGGAMPEIEGERVGALRAANGGSSRSYVAYQCHGSNVGEMGTLRKGSGSVTGGVPFIAHTLRGTGHDASEDGTGRGVPLVAVAMQEDKQNGVKLSPVAGSFRSTAPGSQMGGTLAFTMKDYGADAGEVSPTLRAGGHTNSHANGGVYPAVAFNWQSGGDARGLQPSVTAGALTKMQTPATHEARGVRRLTPREMERLQGFPDDYTAIPWRGKGAKDCPDGNRAKALGNSMAVPVMHWIGERIMKVENVR